MAPKFEKGQMVNIHKRMTPGFGGVYARITSIYSALRPGKSRGFFYRTETDGTVNDATLSVMKKGIEECYLTPRHVRAPPTIEPEERPSPRLARVTKQPSISASQAREKVLATHEVAVVQATRLGAALDTAASLSFITSDEYFVPGTIRESHVAVGFLDLGSGCSTDTYSGMVRLRTNIPGKFIETRMHYKPDGRRTILAWGRLADADYTMQADRTSAKIRHRSSEKLLLEIRRELRSMPDEHELIDSDGYVPSFYILSDSLFVHKSEVYHETHNVEHTPALATDIFEMGHELHAIAGVSKIAMENAMRLHLLLGHVNFRKCQYMLGIRLKKSETLKLFCKYCALAKMPNAEVS